MMKKVDEITKELEQGVQGVFCSDKYREYLTVMSKFHGYSAGNCILIMMQFPEASLVAGYRAWMDKFRRQVKKGEKAIRILAPCPHKKLVLDEQGNEKEIRWTTFRAASVFDVSQTEGEELPTICDRLTGGVDGYAELVRSIKAISPVPVKEEELRVNGCYRQMEREIVLCKGMGELQTVKTLLHEVAHAILHDREAGAEKEADRNTKELQAESVAFTVCRYLGLDTSEYSFEYLAAWSAGKGVKELTKNLEVIRRTASDIIDKLAAWSYVLTDVPCRCGYDVI